MNMRGIKILLCVLLLNFFAVVNPDIATGTGTGGLGGVGTGDLTNPISGSPTGSLTEPASTYDPTAFTIPQPNIASGNMVVTGNVGGGRHFRGYVPYGSSTDIRANLESTSLDSFLRYSSSPSEPFYSPTRSVVPFTQRGAAGAYQPVSQKVRGYSSTNEEYFIPYSSLTATQSATSPVTLASTTRPVTGYDYRQSLLGHAQGYGTAEQFLRLGDELESASRSEQTMSAEQVSLLKPDLESTFESERPKAFEITELAEQPEVSQQTDIYELMRRHLGISEEQIPGELTTRAEANEQIRKAIEEELKAKLEIGQIDTEKIAESRIQRRQAMQQAGGTGATGAASESEETTAPRRYKTFASESGDEFNHYMEAAEQYLKEGKFYQASDAYSLASIYKPMDPLPYAGKCHALFAAGEYLSSVRWLIYALRLFPEYANVRIDLVEIIGDKALIERRTIELAKWANGTDSAELAILLAYICHHMDRNTIAETAIKIAFNKLPEDEVVLSLKKVIEASRYQLQ